MLVIFMQQDGADLQINPLHVATVRESTRGGSILEMSSGTHHFVQEKPEMTRTKLNHWWEETKTRLTSIEDLLETIAAGH